MALKLKTSKTIEDEYGNTYSDAYAVVDQNNGNKKRKQQHFTLETYKDQQARQDDKQPVKAQSYTVTGDEYDTYFAPSVIAADGDQYSQAYQYVKDLEENTGTEEEPVMEKVWKDWEDA